MTRKDTGDSTPFREARLDGVLREVYLDANALLVDHGYQRPLIDEHVKKIAENFDPDKFGCLIVAHRIWDNSTLYVLDGQQRLAAAKLRGVRGVSCMVIVSKSVEHEAEVFSAINKDRVSPTPFQLYMAAVTARDPIVVRIEEYLRVLGLRVVRGGKHKGGISFPATLRRDWHTHADRCSKALQTQRDIADGRALNEWIHKGIIKLLAAGHDVDKYKAAWKKKTVPGLVERIKLGKLRAGALDSARSPRQYAEHLLGVYNESLRNKKCRVEYDYPQGNPE